MDINKIMKSDYLDILYDGRNKDYGGYVLRKNYSKRTRKALLLLLGVSVLSAGVTTIGMGMKPTGTKVVINKQPVNLRDLPPIEQPKVIQPPVAPPPPAKPTVAYTSFIVRRDDDVNDADVPPPVSTITASGPRTEAGDPTGIDPGIVPPSSGSGNGTSIVAPPQPPAVFVYVEQMPAPAYDMAAYLGNALRYPDAARENGIEGSVLVKFIINEDGSVSDVQIARSIGGGCDEEAKRVVASMPKWKPGRQNGKPVRVYFTLPIQFKLQ